MSKSGTISSSANLMVRECSSRSERRSSRRSVTCRRKMRRDLASCRRWREKGNAKLAMQTPSSNRRLSFASSRNCSRNRSRARQEHGIISNRSKASMSKSTRSSEISHWFSLARKTLQTRNGGNPSSYRMRYFAYKDITSRARLVTLR